MIITYPHINEEINFCFWGWKKIGKKLHCAYLAVVNFHFTELINHLFL